MNTKITNDTKKSSVLNVNIRQVPILNIKQMSDDEWNRLTYRQYLQNNAGK